MKIMMKCHLSGLQCCCSSLVFCMHTKDWKAEDRRDASVAESVASAEHPGPVPSTHMAAHIYPYMLFKRTWCPLLGSCRQEACIWHMSIHEGTHSYISKQVLKSCFKNRKLFLNVIYFWYWGLTRVLPMLSTWPPIYILQANDFHSNELRVTKRYPTLV